MKLTIYIGSKVGMDDLAREIVRSDCKYQMLNNPNISQTRERKALSKAITKIAGEPKWEHNNKVFEMCNQEKLVELSDELSITQFWFMPQVEHFHLYNANYPLLSHRFANELLNAAWNERIKHISLYFPNEQISPFPGDCVKRLSETVLTSELNIQYKIKQHTQGLTKGSHSICFHCPHYRSFVEFGITTVVESVCPSKCGGHFMRKNNGQCQLYVNEHCPYYVEHYMEWLKEKNNANAHRATK